MSNKGEKTDMAPRTKGSRLARRARSFKEDLLEKITQMRSPSSTRSGSPYKISPKGTSEETTERRNSIGDDPMMPKALPINDVQSCQNDVMNALRFFRDAVEKKTFVYLPGSTSAVIDAVLHIHNTFQTCLTNEQSSLLLSSNNQVYQSLSSLVHLADKVLLNGERALERDSIIEAVKTVESAVKALMELVVEKMKCKNSSNGSVVSSITSLQNGSPDRWANSDSSPIDLPLSPREMEILQTTKFPSSDTLGHSFSSDNILGSSQDHLDIPPPKPPLPDRREPFRPNGRLLSMGSVPDIMPPALPPKRKHMNSHSPQFGPPYESFFNFPQVGATYSFNNMTGEWDGKRTLSSGDWPCPIGHSSASVSPLSVSGSSLDSTPNRSSDDLLNSLQTELLPADVSAFSYRCQANHSVVWSKTNCSDTVDNIQRRLRDMSCYEMTSGSAYCTSTVKSSQSMGSNVVISSTQTVSSSMAKTSSSCGNCVILEHRSPGDAPPAIPPKRRNPNQRTPSQYDNVPDFLNGDDRDATSSSPFPSPSLLKKSYMLPPGGENVVFSSACHSSSSSSGIADCEPPPPLPPKKKHVMAYMQMFGSCVKTNSNNYIHSVTSQEFSHQEVSVSTYCIKNAVGVGLASASNDSVFFSSESINGSVEANRPDSNDQLAVPPVLPPKKSKNNVPPAKPLNSLKLYESEDIDNGLLQNNTTVHPQGSQESASVSPTEGIQCRSPSSYLVPSDQSQLENVAVDARDCEMQILDELDAKPFLIYKKEGEDGPDIRGGSVAALVIHATVSSKNEIVYQDAFMTTYRTFISPGELIRKLLYRYNKFSHATDVTRQRVSRNAFSLLVRVVGDFSVGDVDEEILKVLTEFVCRLLASGELALARALRRKILEKWNAKVQASYSVTGPLSSKGICTKQSTLLDFKSEQLAEQMTLLDADLFQKIEIPEVLVWSRLQKEDLSPNLTTFTEHFNKMSFWARSRILEKEEAKDRERCTLKFVKIMKHLRKMNNFNSYLAILSALDSAPIVRLEWPKHITEGLKEYSELIDSSSSFRAYRQALAETESPCIPYIGLILQDLTFVHIGNSDFLPDGNVNFSKRWQQFNILDTMKRFRCLYNFKRSERILAFFNNFDDYLCEEAMWQISETIKPRGKGRKTYQGGL